MEDQYVRPRLKEPPHGLVRVAYHQVRVYRHGTEPFDSGDNPRATDHGWNVVPVHDVDVEQIRSGLLQLLQHFPQPQQVRIHDSRRYL
jgi:hypothetical protein